MTHRIKISVKCPHCKKSLMDERVLIDDLPSIKLEAKQGDRIGAIYLSQEYGSYHKKFEKVEDIIGSVVLFSCPHCHEPFPITQICECKAPMIGIQLEVGGMIKICSRNGCKRHALEFEDINDAFMLLMRQDKTGLG